MQAERDNCQIYSLESSGNIQVGCVYCTSVFKSEMQKHD